LLLLGFDYAKGWALNWWTIIKDENSRTHSDKTIKDENGKTHSDKAHTFLGKSIRTSWWYYEFKWRYPKFNGSSIDNAYLNLNIFFIFLKTLNSNIMTRSHEIEIQWTWYHDRYYVSWYPTDIRCWVSGYAWYNINICVLSPRGKRWKRLACHPTTASLTRPPDIHWHLLGMLLTFFSHVITIFAMPPTLCSTFPIFHSLSPWHYLPWSNRSPPWSSHSPSSRLPLII
jgi:hypothetical protein